MFYQVKAVDQLFFRSSVPFEGSQLFPCQFPPYPNTYGGAFQMLAQDAEQRKRLRIGFNGVALNDREKLDICFPQPLDTIVFDQKDVRNTSGCKSDTEDTNGNKATTFILETMKLTPRPESNMHEALPVCLFPETEFKKTKSSADWYMNQTSLEKYLNGNRHLEFKQEKESKHAVDTDGSKLFDLKDYLSKERKIGIGTDIETGQTKKGQLYQIEMVRPKEGLQLIVEASSKYKGEEKLAIDQAHVKLGGEGKMVQVEKLDQPEFLESLAPNDESKFFKLYFATPAIFEHGWYPSWIDNQKTLTGKFSYRKKKQDRVVEKKLELKLIAAAVGKPELIGGFDPHGKEPKALRYAIPAGSVYYFEILNYREGDFEKAKKLFHRRCLSDYREGSYKGTDSKKKQEAYQFNRPKQVFDRLIYCDRGLGYALVGAVDKKIIEELEKNV
ncbi:MAG: hypothetical protein FWG67_06155 [Defluviitaleaceae bacterium]|nr:hypothetical protein [Defluviitaleaceae bacterium]